MPLGAAIDIGTNSVKMTIADLSATGGPSTVATYAKTTRLGKGVDRSGLLDEWAMHGTVAEIVHYRQILTERGVEKVAVVGTSALRDAANGAEFLSRVRAEAGFEIEIVTGDREAELAYVAVYADVSLGIDQSAPLVVFDVGGGSTELIFGRGPSPSTHRSVDIGAVRLTERVLTGDPPPADQIAGATRMARELITGAGLPEDARGSQLVGLGGTLVNLAAVAAADSAAQSGAVTARSLQGSMLVAGQIDALLGRLAGMTLAERRLIHGLEPERADVIVGGAIVVMEVLRYVGAVVLRVSERGLRFGLLCELGGLCRPTG